MNDLWAQEKEVTRIFQSVVSEVGYWEADRIFDEAGLFDDMDEEDKLERAILVARKLGATLEWEE